MPDSTNATSSELNWRDIINVALDLYSKNQGSGSTPNFYPVPDSPQEIWRNDATKNLYNFASGYTEQFLHGLNNLNPDFQMPNNATGNPAFMGGIKVPQIDFSKIPSPTGVGTSTPIPATPPTGLGSGNSTTGVPGDAFGHIGAPAGSAGDPFAGMPQNMGDAQQTGLGQIWEWMKAHPEVAKLGADAVAAGMAAAGGPIAGLIGMVGDKLFRLFVSKAAPSLPIIPTTVKAGDLTPAGYPGAQPPRTNMNPPGLTDPWSSPFMGGGISGGAGGSDPGLRGYDWRNSIINGPTAGGHYR